MLISGWSGWGAGRLRLLGRLLLPLVVALCGVLVGFHLFFPSAALKERLLQTLQRQLPPGATVTVAKVTAVFPLRLSLDNLVIGGLSGPLPEVSFAHLGLSPTLASLFGSPGVTVAGRGPLGRFSGRLQRDGQVQLRLEEGRFGLIMPEWPQVRLSGELTALDFSGRLPPGPQSSLQLQVDAEGLTLNGLERFGLATQTLPLGALQLRIEGAGNSLQLRLLTLTGGVVELRGSGELLVQSTLPASRIDLALQLHLAEQVDPALRSLLDLAAPATADGDYRLRLRGPLRAPALN